MKYLKISIERIGVLIGHNGETKKDLEEKSGFKINIDSELGEIVIDDHEVEDPLMLIKIENIIKANSRGFSPENAFLLFNDENDFYYFNIYDYTPKKETHIRRIKGRIIGKQGKTKRVLEELTESKIVVYGHTVSIITNDINMNIAKKAIDMILTGSKQASVYRFLEKQMKDLKKQDYGF